MKKILIVIIAAVVFSCLGWYGYNAYYKGLDAKAVIKTLDVLKDANILKQNENLYSAYETVDGVRKWGYINDEGKFVISPVYDRTEQFQENGLAKVYSMYQKSSSKDQVGLIDKNGKLILEPKYTYISDFSEGYAIAGEAGKYEVIDVKGKSIFENQGSIQKFSNGAAVFEKKENGKSIYGYIDVSGKVIIEPKYKTAYEFNKDNKALVSIEDGKYAIVDKSGTILNTLNYENMRGFSEEMIIFFDKKVSKHGYISETGKILTEAIFNSADQFSDGFAIVRTPKNNLWGKERIINIKGDYINTDEYDEVNYLGKGLFAIRKSTDDYTSRWTSPMAIINKDGKQLTDFIHYDVGEFAGEIACASDNKYTYFIDLSGNCIADLPKLEGIGSMKIVGEMIKAELDGELMYLKKDGKIVWKSDQTHKLENGIIVMELKYRPNRNVFKIYPYVEGMKDSGIQDSINKQLEKLFIGERISFGEMNEEAGMGVSESFNVDLNKDMLIIEKQGYYYPFGAAHGQPSRAHYHVNLKNGSIYKLKDLFKKDSGYISRLNAILGKQIIEKSKKKDSMFFPGSFLGINENQGFVLTKDSIKIYFAPYEIAAYAAGFVEVDIPYGDVIALIDTNGELWNSFEKNAVSKATLNADEELKDNFDTVIRIYEQGLVSAINMNDFKYVEPYLLKDSNLYKSQKELVKSLSNQGIKEKYVSSQVEKVEYNSQKEEYKAYVKEEVEIKYQGKDFVTKQFYYIYTVKYSKEKQNYLLSDIAKWER